MTLYVQGVEDSKSPQSLTFSDGEGEESEADEGIHLPRKEEWNVFRIEDPKYFSPDPDSAWICWLMTNNLGLQKFRLMSTSYHLINVWCSFSINMNRNWNRRPHHEHFGYPITIIRIWSSQLCQIFCAFYYWQLKVLVITVSLYFLLFIFFFNSGSEIRLLPSRYISLVCRVSDPVLNWPGPDPILREKIESGSESRTNSLQNPDVDTNTARF